MNPMVLNDDLLAALEQTIIERVKDGALRPSNDTFEVKAKLERMIDNYESTTKSLKLHGRGS